MRCLVNSQKSHRRTDRRVKELTFSQEEDCENHGRRQELVDKLQNKVKSYKKQIEEAKKIAALNLAKFRKVESSLEQAEERAHINEQVPAKYKSKAVEHLWDLSRNYFKLRACSTKQVCV